MQNYVFSFMCLVGIILLPCIIQSPNLFAKYRKIRFIQKKYLKFYVCTGESIFLNSIFQSSHDAVIQSFEHVSFTSFKFSICLLSFDLSGNVLMYL